MDAQTTVQAIRGSAVVTLASGLYTHRGVWATNFFGWCETKETELRTENGARWVIVVRESESGAVRAVIPGCQIRAVVLTATCPENIPNLTQP